MKLKLTALFNLILVATFAQTSNFIEIAVDEMIQLAPESARIQICLESSSEQMHREFYNDEYSEYDYDEYDYYDSEEDWMYEEMLHESPKKITKEMKKDYEERQKRRLEHELQREEEEKAREQKIKDFKPIELSDLQTKLDELGISYRKIKNTSESSYSEYDYYDYYDEREDSEDFADSSLEVVLTSTEDWSRLENGLKDFPTEINVLEVKYGSMDDEINETIPKLTEKAQKQAQIMANSINRKLGKVIECTNVYPYTPSMSYLSSFTGHFEELSNRRSDSNPFESTKDEVIQYVYRFSLLN